MTLVAPSSFWSVLPRLKRLFVVTAGIALGCLYPVSGWSAHGASALDVGVLKGKRLLDVLNQLNQHHYNIVFSSSQITADMIVGEIVQPQQGEALVRALLAQFHLGVKVGPKGSLIVVKKPRHALYFDLGGNVLDNANEPVFQAKITVRSTSSDNPTSKHSVSDKQGRFAISDLPYGRYHLSVQAQGLSEYQSDIEYRPGVSQPEQVDITLSPLPIESITITTNQYDISYAQSNDQMFMQQQDIERLSHLANDINRALAHVPGIAGGDFSARLHIRGGATQENSFILDGMPLYDPFHMKESGSFFTVIDAFTIGAAEIITGGATAEFGDHLSGVVNLTSKEWDEDMPTALGINFLHAKVRASGQLGLDNPQDNWLVSARHGFLRVVGAVSEVELDNYNPEYTDVFAKVNKQVSDDTSLTWHSLVTIDMGACFNACVGQHDGEDVNQYHWLTAQTRWNEKLVSQTLLGHGDLAFTRNGTEQNEQRFQILNDDLDWNFTLLKQDWRYSSGDDYLIKGGVELRDLQARYHYALFLNQQNLFIPFAEHPQQVSQLLNFDEEGNSYGVYLAPVIRVTPRLTTELGVRWDKQSYLQNSQVSPRLHLDYLHPQLGNFKGSYGVYHQAQGIQQLLVESRQNAFFEAQKVKQFNLSYQASPFNDFQYKVSIYHKDYDELSPRIESQFGDDTYIFEGRPDRITLDPEKAVSRGVELALYNTWGESLTGWLSYGYNRTREKVDGQWFDRQWDQRHSLNLGLDYQFSDACHTNVAANFHSGWRYTPVIVNQAAAIGDINNPYLSFGERYSARYPHFLSVDMRIGCEYHWKKNRLRLFFEVVNLFDRKNLVSETGHYLQYSRANPLPLLIGDDDTYIPRIPSIGILWEF